jgi:hypothetical protein
MFYKRPYNLVSCVLKPIQTTLQTNAPSELLKPWRSFGVVKTMYLYLHEKVHL